MQTPKALSTRLVLLLEVHNHPHARLRTLAERLDVTVQAVSDYLKRLSNEGLVENVSGFWRPTKRGTALLHDTMRDLLTFVEGAMGSLRIIEETYALADRTIAAEQEVGLHMRDGRLHAGAARGAESHGRARTSAERDHLVLVGDLKGLLPLRPASIRLLVHPEFPTGPVLDRARRELKRAVPARGRALVAAHDVTSLAWVWTLGLEVDLEFAAPAAAREAAQRGVPVVYFVPQTAHAALETQLRDAGRLHAPLPLRRVVL